MCAGFDAYVENMSTMEYTPHSTDKISKIKNHIKEQTSTIQDNDWNEVEGMTLEKLEELRKFIENKKKEYEEIAKLAKEEKSKNTVTILDHTGGCPTYSGSTEMCGAFDNYYNHNTSTGSFTVQVLNDFESPQKYLRFTGTTSNNSKNANIVSQFKSYINQYEDYVIQDMEGAHWSEVAGWVSTLSGFVLFAVSVATGPAGWVAYAINTASVLSTFIGLTSTAYGTYTRLTYSRNAATAQVNAQVTANRFFTEAGQGASASFTLVTGF